MRPRFLDKLLKPFRRPRPEQPEDAIVPGTDSFNVFWDWIKSPTTVDKDLRRNLARQRAEARTLAIGNPVVRQYLTLLKVNVIGPRGMKHQARVRLSDGTLDKSRNDRIEAAWADFWAMPWLGLPMSGVPLMDQPTIRRP